MAIGNVKKVCPYVKDDFKAIREFLERIAPYVEKKHYGLKIGWRKK